MANTHSLDLESGSSQYLSIVDGSQTGLDITGDISMEAWVKLESQPATNNQINFLSKYVPAGNQRAYSWAYRDISGTTGFRLSISSDGTSSNLDNLDQTKTLTTGTWYHIACTLDVSGSEAKFYVDGQRIGTVTGSETGIHNSTGAFIIGAQGNIASFFDGLIDDVRVWNDLRTDAEISDNYQTELVGNEANLVGYWKLNNGLLDETSNNNDLTNNNSAVFSTDIPDWPAAATFIQKAIIF